MNQFKLIIILTLLGLIMVFTVQNYKVVELQFLIWRLEMSRALLFFFVFAGGVILGWMIRGHK
ncbi:MAG: LapA family protein [Nitrospirales bacterium]|nr:LapA family protein [Nitrospirales bacterium]